MADAKSKSEERREAIQKESRETLSTFYYPELGHSVQAKDREAADKLVEDELKQRASEDAGGEDQA